MSKKVTADPALYGPGPGREVLDPTPVALPLGYEHPESLEDTVMRLLRSEQLAREARNQGVETFEEFMDFGDESDDDPHTPHEEFWDPVFRRPVTMLELMELDKTLKGGGSVQFSEADNHALRLHLREVAAAKAPIPSNASGGEATAAQRSPEAGSGSPPKPAVTPGGPE